MKINMQPVLYTKNFFHDHTFVFETRGSVENTIIMVPLIAIFLGVLQISAFAFSHNSSLNMVQGEISRLSLLRTSSSSLNPLVNAESQIERIELPGGGAILINSSKRRQLLFSEIFSGMKTFTVTGVAIDEN